MQKQWLIPMNDAGEHLVVRIDPKTLGVSVGVAERAGGPVLDLMQTPACNLGLALLDATRELGQVFAAMDRAGKPIPQRDVAPGAIAQNRLPKQHKVTALHCCRKCEGERALSPAAPLPRVPASDWLYDADGNAVPDGARCRQHAQEDIVAALTNEREVWFNVPVAMMEISP